VTGHRAGQRIDDLCRACKAVRDHTVMATDAEGNVLRVVCDFCRSEHNYRGGGGEERPARAAAVPAPTRPRLHDEGPAEERTPEMSVDDPEGLERLLRKVIREEAGVTPVPIAPRWRGGQLVLKPGTPTQEKVVPIDTFFHKIVMLRNRLRTLEQQVNASALAEDEKVKLQSYITACYGSLTSFNVLFAAAEDQFRGSGSE
jgi:hypothetical protein